MNRQEWHLKRNCSMTPRQALLSYLVLCGLSLAAALPCLLHGSWTVMGFSSAGMMTAAVFWLLHARHATDYEHVAMTDDCLLVEQVDAGVSRLTRLDRRRTRVVAPSHFGALIRLEACGSTAQIGRHVPPAKRGLLADELRRSLRQDAWAWQAQQPAPSFPDPAPMPSRPELR
jgi:uncharacterized membrane protein